MRRLTAAKLVVVGGVLLGTFFTNMHRVHADALPEQTPAATISASCFDQASNLAYWSITNPGTDPVTINWTTDDEDASGTFTAAAGDSQLTTPYNGNEPTESFIFSQPSQDDVTLQVPETACEAPTPPPCVDGTIRSNLQFDFSELGIATIRTADGGLLCEDVTLYFSSYTLPADYDRSGIFDDSSIPQQLFASQSVVLPKGTAGGQTVRVAVPNVCITYQLDLYYAPEITIVTGAGHGTQLLYGRIYVGSDTGCTVAPGQGGKGAGGDSTPPADNPPATPAPTQPTTPVATPAATPAAAKLTDTGTQTWLTTMFGVVLLTSGIAVRFAYTGRKGE